MGTAGHWHWQTPCPRLLRYRHATRMGGHLVCTATEVLLPLDDVILRGLPTLAAATESRAPSLSSSPGHSSYRRSRRRSRFATESRAPSLSSSPGHSSYRRSRRRSRFSPLLVQGRSSHHHSGWGSLGSRRYTFRGYRRVKRGRSSRPHRHGGISSRGDDPRVPDKIHCESTFSSSVGQDYLLHPRLQSKVASRASPASGLFWFESGNFGCHFCSIRSFIDNDQ